MDALPANGIDEFKLDRPIGQKLQGPPGTAVGRGGTGQGGDGRRWLAFKLRRLTRTGLVVD